MSQQQDCIQGMKMGWKKFEALFSTLPYKNMWSCLSFNLEKDSMVTGAKEKGVSREENK